MERRGHAGGERFLKRGILPLVCWALGSTLVGRSFTAVDPDPSDVQLFAYIGLKWAQGAIPYVDIWDHKPPGIFAVLAAVFLLFPKSFTAVACLEGVFTLGCIGTVYGLTRQWGMPWSATILATGSAAVTSNLAYYTEHGTFPEVYLLWPATLSMYCFGKAFPTFRGHWIFLAGVCSGVASLFKPTGLSPLLAQAVLVLLLWVVVRRVSWRHALGSVLANGTGVLVAWLPVALYFWLHHAFVALVNASLLYNIRYGIASQGTIWQVLILPFTLASSLQLLASLVVCTLMGLILYAGRWMVSQRAPETDDASALTTCPWWLLGLLWVGCDLAGALAGGRNYRHYFLTLAPSLSLAAAFSYWVLLEQLPGEARARWGPAVFGILIVGPLIVAQAADVGQVLRWGLLPGEPPGGSPSELVAAHLSAIRRPSDTLFTWDYLPTIYLATEMTSPTRQLDAHYIYDFTGSYTQYGEELLRTLRRTPPSFIVGGWSTTSDEKPEARDPVYRQFREFLAKNYLLIYTADNLKIYEHRVPGPVTGQ